MNERVLPMIKKLHEAGIKAEYWNGFSMIMSKEENLANNDLWIQGKLKEGFTVIDIGLDPRFTRNVLLPFEKAFEKRDYYNLELSNVWRYTFSK